MKHQNDRRDFMKLGAAGLSAAAVVGGATALNTLPARQAAAQSNSDSLLRKVLDRGTVRVGTGSTNAPWHFVDERGNLTGMDIAMGRILAKGLFDDESKVEFIRQEGAQRIPNIVADKVDVSIQFMTVTSKRSQLVAFTRPYFVEQMAILTKKEGKRKTTDELLAAGSDATISILQNFEAEIVVHEALPEAKVLQLDSVGNAIQALDSGRADGASISLSAARWLIKKNPARYVEAGINWYPQVFGGAVRQGDPDWLRYVSTVFSVAIYGPETKTYRAAMKEYFGLDPVALNPGYPLVAI